MRKFADCRSTSSCASDNLNKVKFHDKLYLFLFTAGVIVGGPSWSQSSRPSNAPATAAGAVSEDKDLAEKLRTDLEFDTNRRNAYQQHRDEDKIYDQERDKGLALFLEEEERWNRLREKESRDHANTRAKPMDEFGPEYNEDIREKNQFEKQRELDRVRHVRTKKKLYLEFEDKIPQSEERELGIAEHRPRYELRKRARNKWVNAGKVLGGSGSSGGGSPFDGPSIPQPSPGDFVAPPMDNSFEDIPPPPPPIPYDNFDNSNAGGFDSGFGDMPPPPPPPSNDPSWDF